MLKRQAGRQDKDGRWKEGQGEVSGFCVDGAEREYEKEDDTDEDEEEET